MLALSLLQPWASLVACGDKEWETRSWRPSGQTLGSTVAIHASKSFKKADRDWYRFLCETLALNAGPADQMPLGAIVAVATLSALQRTEVVTEWIPPKERTLGDYSPGRWAWQLLGVRKLDVPIPVTGALGLWTMPDDVAESVRVQVKALAGRV